jgi:hypothetical protein
VSRFESWLGYEGAEHLDDLDVELSPAQRRSSATAASREIAALYGRSLTMASKASRRTRCGRRGDVHSPWSSAEGRRH